MRFASDDGQFGILLEAVGEYGMFTFQLIVGGQVVGDSDPCFPASGLAWLGTLSSLDDERLSKVREDPAGVLTLLVTSEELHDKAIFAAAESLDLWLTCAYLHDGNATILAQARQDWDDETLVGPIRVSIVPLGDYEGVLEAARAYFVEKDPRQRQP